MSGRVYLGFDPGMSGAIAAIHPDGVAVVFDMPTVVTFDEAAERARLMEV